MAEMGKKTPFSFDPELARSPSFQRTHSEPPPPLQNSAQGRGANKEGAKAGRAGLGSDMVRSARRLVDAEVGREAGKGAEQVGGLANALRETSKGLEDNVVSPYVERAADQLGRLADYLKKADVNEIVSSVEEMARKQPLVFVGGAFALGFVGARFFRSGSPTRISERRSEQGRGER